MVRLYLLGFTHDLKGVVFTQRKSGKQATFWAPVDEMFLDAIDKLEAARQDKRESARARKAGKGKGRTAARAARAKGRATEERVVLPPVGRSQSSSALPAAEIQQLLRQGRSVNAVVEAAKAPRAWVERLLEPVMAERVGVVRLAQGSKMTRSRLGRSGLPLGEAVLRNLQERRATVDTIEGLDDAWDARAQAGRWRVWVKFNHRGKRRTAEWEFRKDTRQVTPRNRLGAQLGWWAPELGAALEPIEALDGTEAPAGEEKEAARPRRRRPARKKTSKRKPASRRRAAATRRGPARKLSPRRPPRSSARRRP
jgi:hypothetical protein